MKPSLVIVGLGNPGAQYERTRHNMGFRAIDVLAEALPESEWKDMRKFDSLGYETRIVAAPVLLLKPLTYMNLSGNAVRKVIEFYKLDPASQLLVLTDDIDLPIGELRVRESGGPGTHNGLRSISEIYGEHYARLRIGLGAPQKGEDLATWVLSIPSSEEEVILNESIGHVPGIVKEFVM